MSPLLHQWLLNEATQHGTKEVLRQMPVAYSPELEQGVREAVLRYAHGLDSLSQQPQPLEQARKGRA